MPNEKEKTTVALEYPFPEERVFRYQAMQDVLTLLVEEPYTECTVSQLATMIESNQASVSKAIALLKKLGSIQTRRDGRKQYVSINRDRLTKSDPVLSVPQTEFQKPIRAFVERADEEITDLVGIVLFGSVARDEADRASDIDLLVFVDADRTQARSTVQEILSDLEETKFDGNRYEFETLVESTDSAKRIRDRLRQQFEDSITLVGSDELSNIRTEVFSDGE